MPPMNAAATAAPTLSPPTERKPAVSLSPELEPEAFEVDVTVLVPMIPPASLIRVAQLPVVDVACFCAFPLKSHAVETFFLDV